jgi:hypothetical protein
MTSGFVKMPLIGGLSLGFVPSRKNHASVLEKYP